jgi:hypothetical protein
MGKPGRCTRPGSVRPDECAESGYGRLMGADRRDLFIAGGQGSDYRHGGGCGFASNSSDADQSQEGRTGQGSRGTLVRVALVVGQSEEGNNLGVKGTKLQIPPGFAVPHYSRRLTHGYWAGQGQCAQCCKNPPIRNPQKSCKTLWIKWLSDGCVEPSLPGYN